MKSLRIFPIAAILLAVIATVSARCFVPRGMIWQNTLAVGSPDIIGFCTNTATVAVRKNGASELFTQIEVVVASE